MSSDEEIPGLGKLDERLRHNPAVALERLPLTSEEYFVWTRVDGHTATREVILLAGFPRDRTIAILRRLRELGALLREGETPASVASAASAASAASVARPAALRRAPESATPPARPAPAQAPAAAAPATSRGPAPAPTLDSLGALTSEERAALTEEVDLGQEQKLRVIAMRRKADAADYFALLEVDASADKRALKRAYFLLSKEFHPDRYYGKHTGSFGPWLARIFERLKEAHEILSDDKKRREYEGRLSGQREVGSQTKLEYATELFERACNVQTNGELAWALQLFAAAIRLDPQARYLSRAARCAIDAGDTALAVTYAHQAVGLEPENPSLHRVLASAQEAAGDLAAAEATLEAALVMKSENDSLSAGLRTDLTRVRGRRGAPPGT
jgi:tetratricopeptide (TPR) repeat protein